MAEERKDDASPEPVNKQGFTRSRVTAMLACGPIDAVVVGSGMAGLTAAAMLSLAGWRVLVLEQHDVAGGTTHAFVQKDKFEFDTGLHYVGAGLPDNPLLGAISQGRLQFTEQDPETGVYDIATDGAEQFPMHRGHPALCERLCERFPEERAAIRNYFGEVQRWKLLIGLLVGLKMAPGPALTLAGGLIGLAAVWLTGLAPVWLLALGGLLAALVAVGLEPVGWAVYGRLAAVSTEDKMRRLGMSDRLIGVLTYNWGDYGTLPAKSPFFVQAVHWDHWNEGGFYPVGGPSQIAVSVIPTIEAAGGCVLVRAAVSQIELDSTGAVQGVKVRGISVPTKTVISSVGAHGTFAKLLDGAAKLPRSVAEMRSDMSKHAETRGSNAPSCAMASLFVALEGDNPELPASNLWMFRSWSHQQNIDEMMAAESAETCQLAGGFMAFPSRKDAAWTARWPGCTVCEILVPVNFEWFEHWDGTRIHARGKDYDQMKERLSQRLLEECLYRYHPQCRGKVVHYELGTPLSNNFYFGTDSGEVYGMDHSVGRFSPETQKKLRFRTEVPGLFLSGQDSLINGVMGAMMSGALTAVSVSKLAALRCLVPAIRAKSCIVRPDETAHAKKHD